MLRVAEDADLVDKLKGITARTGAEVQTGEVAAVVESVLQSLTGDMSVADLKLYRELEQLARYIQRAKREIAEIQPHDISARIPLAKDELDAVVDATAEATGTILDAAETTEKLVPKMQKDIGATIASAVTRIYEACNFQDITGQRITKVVETLKYIEAKIEALLAAFDEGIGEPSAVKPLNGDSLATGPQLPVHANKQADIDAILASFDK
jgi:chemotaxis protein CheZ